MSEDLCSYIWNHELAMRRLLTFLRQSQSQCNDSECFYPLTTRPETEDDGFLMVFCCLALALFLFVMRPTSLRSVDKEPTKSNFNGNGGGEPRDPPAAPNAF